MTHDRHAAMAGLAFALGGYALLTVGDAVVKSMAGMWPGTAIATLRYVLGTIWLIGLVAWQEGKGGFTFPDKALHWGRGASVAFGSACFFIALNFMPIAEATVIQFASPIIVAVLSAVVLGERGTRATWMATALAFAGVVVVVRPNLAHVGLAGLLPLGTATFMATMLIFNRKVAGRASALKMQLLLSATAVPVLLAITFGGHVSGISFLHVTMPEWSVVARCAIVSVTATVAHGLIYMATERVSAANMAPATYVQLLVAVLLGMIFFKEHPDYMTGIGAALIIIAGLILWRGQKLAVRRMG